MGGKNVENAALPVAKNRKRGFRYLLSRILMRSGVSHLLTFKTHGYKLRFFPTDLSAELWHDPRGRERDIKFLQTYLKSGDCFVDVGANIGSTVVAGAAAVGATGQVIAFEPHPKIFRYLVENVQLNNIETVISHNFALGSAPGLAMFTDLGSDDQNQIVSKSNDGIGVKVATLDSFAIGCDGVQLIKIDVEGYEAQVLAGAASTLTRTSGVYLEIHGENLLRYDSSAGEVIDGMRNSGFSILRWHENTLIELAPDWLPSFKEDENVVAVKSVDELQARLGSAISICRL